MAESRKRRARKRLTIELEAADEEVVQRLRIGAVKGRRTLREYVLQALRAYLDATLYLDSHDG